MYESNLILLLLQQMCVFLVIAWLMSKTRLFIPLMQVTVRLPHKLLCYITFSVFCIMGTYFGLHIEGSIANTRAIGAVMGGLLGGPVMIIILLIARPFQDALHLVESIAAPMMVTNTLGAAMFMRILLDKRAMFEKYTSAFSATALKVAASTEGILRQGFNEQNSLKVAKVLHQELDISAVAITDRERLLAFIGTGADHHLAGKPISSGYTWQAIENNEVVYADGNEVPYRCSLHPNCKLGSTLVIPLRGENQRVIGTIKLYEARNRLFSSINRTLGEGIAQLLSAQILAGKYEQQKALLAQSEIKLLHAQVNPHFLFNALNTLKAVIRHDGDKAGQLVQYLSTFFRKNLKRPSEIVTLSDEIEHVNAYLQIELARFQTQLAVNWQVPDELANHRLPAFTLQPIVENAIKHGTSQQLGNGMITIRARTEGNDVLVDVEDNAGLYRPKENRLWPGRELRAGMFYLHHRTFARRGVGMLRVLIVDDEPLARENLRILLENDGEIEIVGECANAIEAISAVNKLRPDVLFLDIQMPRISGLEMVGMLDERHRPRIVFLTAFDEYAVQAFEECAFDYLLKPIESQRLQKTLARLHQEAEAQDVSRLPDSQQPLKFIPCSGHSRIWLLQMEEVAYVSSRMSGVYVTSRDGKEGFTELTLRTLESRTSLLRCHRQYLVNMNYLQEIRLEDNSQAELLLRDGRTVPVSRRYLKSLKEAVGL
ncbi:putative sensor-like histidine kinase YehU [Beauveria bassiana D1-5]|uniref:histidine kinase n=2 Tax=cellular organisms TaxID=131567 RepID=A0A0A2VZB2_BEABA|nr:putative sensor-like histidine kinase YehU [Beauveria bassiana D1-5]